MSNKDSLGDRMKRYESVSSEKLLTNSPVIVRVDGKAFHTFCKKFVKPFDYTFQTSMIRAASKVASEMQGFKLAYVQSDEASFLLTDYDRHETEGWFAYKRDKIISVTASLMTYFFNEIIRHYYEDPSSLPVFDCRAFNVPREDIVNYFLWRAKDWERNSLMMYCQDNFSHNKLHGKSRSEQHDMLHSIGKNWTNDLSDLDKNGTFIYGKVLDSSVAPRYEDIDALFSSIMKEVETEKSLSLINL